MTWGILLSILPPFSVGLLLVRRAWRFGGVHGYALQLTFASALAIGLSSCTFFLFLLKPWSVGPGLLLSETVFFLFIAVALMVLRKPISFSPVHPGSVGTGSFSLKVSGSDPVLRGLILSFSLVLLCIAVAFTTILISKPHGLGDAWAIWNLHARFLFRGGDQWTVGFSNMLAWSHPDYPLLIPSSVARLWTYLGRNTLIVPQMTAVFFSLATILTLASSLAFLRSPFQGMTAGLFLMATSYFVKMGPSQYADIPVGFFILASLASLAMKDAMDEENCAISCLAGAMAGLAAWTKNEGSLFFLTLFLARLILHVSHRKLKPGLRESASLLGGAFPALAVLALFKLRYAPPGDLFQFHDLPSFAAQLCDGSRYALIGGAMGSEVLHWGNGLLIILAFFVAFSGVRVVKKHRSSIISGTVVLFLMTAGYFVVYLLSPHDLKWHLATSLQRLCLQLWPSFLFIIFLMVNPLKAGDPVKPVTTV